MPVSCVDKIWPAATDGSPRLACENMQDCYPWVNTECPEPSELNIKAYCYDKYCYALCPPVLPGISPNTTTLLPPNDTHTARETTITVTKPVGSTVTLTPALLKITVPLPSGNPGDKDDDWQHTSFTTTYPQLDTTDAETQTMTTITKPDGRTITVPIPVPLPTFKPPQDDDDKDKDWLWRSNTALATKTM